MKTNSLHTAFVIGTASTLLVCMRVASAEEPNVSQKSHDFKGTLVSLDSTDGTMSVKSFWRTRTFNLTDNCKVSLEDKPQAALNDLRPGQKIEVFYQSMDGVLIARHINQQNLVFKGRVTAFDANQRTLSVKHTGLTRDFALAADCPVKKQGVALPLKDLRMGQIVSVVYEPNGDSYVARRIEQQDHEFSGTIQAIDSQTRTVKAKSMLNERKFNLTDDCKIIIAGQAEARLRDLRIGDRVSLSYEDRDGVLVANRIGRDESASQRTQENVQAAVGSTASVRSQAHE
jgi:Cu/Ag efflux protein CusF